MKDTDSKFGSIHKALGCNQDQLATYLGVSRGLLANVESKRRTLPANAELKLLELYLVILNTQPAPEPPACLPDKETDKWLRQLQMQLTRQQRRVEAMQAKRAAAIDSLQYIAAIREQVANGEALDLFLRVLEAKANADDRWFTAEKLALEQLKLQSLEAAVTIARQAFQVV